MNNKNIKDELIKLSNAVFCTADSVMICDSKGVIEYVNPAFERLTGYVKEEVIGKTPKILNSGKHDFSFYEKLWNTIISGKVFRTEFINKTKYGQLYSQAETITPIVDENGSVTSFVSTGRDITEHKRLEEIQLERESERRFRIMSDSAPVMIWMADADKKFNFFNKGWLDFTGCTIDLEKEDGWQVNVHPDDLQKLLELHLTSFEYRVEFKMEYRHKRADGAYRWLLTKGVPRFNQAMGFVGYIGACVDITDRKKAEKSIYSIIAKHTDGILVVDMDGIVRFANPAAEMIFKRKMKRLIGENFGLPVVSGEITELDIVRADGDLGVAEMRIDTTEWEGELAHLVSLRDITKRKRAEESLRNSKANLAEAQHIAHLGSWDLDVANNKFYCSKEIFNIFGLTEDKLELNYDEFMLIVHPDDREYLQKAVSTALQNKKPYNIDHRIVQPDGAERVVREQAKVTFDDSGVATRMNATVLDITENRHMENELSKAQKLESIGILAGGIAHDFNNILTAILGNTNLAMIYAEENKKVCDCLGKIEKATKQARDLTQQLLTFSKGGAPVKKTIFINGLIKDSAELALRGASVICKFSIDDDVWPVDADEGQLNQVINNLVINAVQAMPDGGKIEICVKNINESDSAFVSTLEHGRYIKIAVKDNGIGIENNKLISIFDPYFTTKEHGSGLGLATSYSIIKNHGGLITVESEKGRGTTFSVYLPASIKSVQKEDKGEIKQPVGSGKILIMDDEDVIRDTSCQLLRYIGYEVESAEDGKEAIELYKNAKSSGKPFDVVIMDLTVPGGMGGRETVRLLHGIDPAAKAVVFSGYSNDPVMAKHRDYGFCGVITKPFKLNEMNDLLMSVISVA